MAWYGSVRLVPVSMLLAAVASGLLESEFAYDVDAPEPFAADEIERELLLDGGRSWPRFEGLDEYYPSTDLNLAALRPISAMPPFTLDPSYISPAEVIPARAKRANRSGQRKRAQRQQNGGFSELDDEQEEGQLEDAQGKKNSGESADGGVEDYAARYEQFIAEHFEDDGERRRGRQKEKSSPQRKAPAHADDDDEEEDEEDEGRKDADGDYRFDRFDYSSSDDYERIKAESEEQSRRLAKDPRNCRTYEKDGMVCSVCHDPASDSASESCAYATEPHHRKYAYVKERNYSDAKKPPVDDRDATDGEEEEEEREREREHELSEEESRPERQAATEIGEAPSKRPPTARKAHPLRKPTTLRSKPHQLATNGGGYRYQPPAMVDLRSNRATSMKLRTAAGADEPNIYVMDYDDQDDVARVLADFKSRDWSNCRKGKRAGGSPDDGGLTCYQCQDAAGVNHEECMYVSESRQVATGVVAPPPSPVAATDGKQRKRKKVVPLRQAQTIERSAALRDASALTEPQPEDGGLPAKEKQTVKRTVSFRSFVSGRGPPAAYFPLASDASERVIHYEHHVSHEVP